MTDITPIHLVDGLAGRLRNDLIQHMDEPAASRLRTGLPESGPAVVLLGASIPMGADDLQRAAGIVLLAPSLAERDRVRLALAGHERTWLSIVSDPAIDVLAQRTFGDLLHVTDDAPFHGGTVGFLGFDELGRRLAKLLAALEASVIFWAPGSNRRAFEEEQSNAIATGARRVPFDELLRVCDALIVDLPDDPLSTPLIGRAELALLRDDALLINTTASRAIDDGALIQALRGDYLGGVVLGRTNLEPLPADSPLRSFERVLLSSSAASLDEERRRRLLARRAAHALAKRPELGVGLRRVRHVTRRRPGSGLPGILETEGLC